VAGKRGEEEWEKRRETITERRVNVQRNMVRETARAEDGQDREGEKERER